MRGILVVLGLIAGPGALLAQEPVVVRGDRLGRRSAVARQAVAVFNDPSTASVFGSFTIERSDVYEGDVAITNGTLVVRGEIHGDVVAINADVELRAGSLVSGDILVLGGSLRRTGDARLRGNTRLHRADVATRRAGDRLVLEDVEPRTRRRTLSRGTSSGGASIVLTTGGTYNRVEGLPILAGPRLTWGGRNGPAFMVEALAIARTAGDFNSDDRQDIGYDARATISTGGNAGLVLGAGAYHRVESIESWQLPDDEVGWGSFLWHRDYRDYYYSRGYEGFAEIRPDEDLMLRGSIARNEETTAVTRDPWTPFRNDDRWRPNPLADAGTFTSIRAEILWDTQQDSRNWTSAWFFNARFEQGTSDNITPVPLPARIRTPLLANTTYTFRTLFVDLRRYERTGDGELRFRLVGAGTIGDDPLPVQRRWSLGGPEPLPGFPFREFTCAGGLVLASAAALCDRMVLGQVEYRGGLSFATSRSDSRPRNRHDRRDRRDHDYFDWDWFWIDGPDVVFFANAGTAWLDADGPGDIEADVGAGFEFGSLGIYGAKAITDGASARFTIRLHRRF